MQQQQVQREIPSLSLTCLRTICKSPNGYLTDATVNRTMTMLHCLYSSNVMQAESHAQIFTQTLIDHITDAGRMGDDAMPLSIFSKSFLTLSIRNSKISGTFITSITSICTSLTSLDVSGCFLIDDHTIKKILQSCNKMNHLNIRNCRKITDAGVESLVQHGQRLESIHLGGNFNITSAGVNYIIQRHTNASKIKDVNVSGLPVTMTMLTALCKSFVNLSTLCIGYIALSDLELSQLVNMVSHNIKHLAICWIHAHSLAQLDGASGPSGVGLVEHIARTCPRLQSLDVSGMNGVTGGAIVFMIEHKKTQVSMHACFTTLYIIYRLCTVLVYTNFYYF